MLTYLGRTPTDEKIAPQYFWYGIYNNVANYIQKCERCQRQHSLPPNVKSEIYSIEVSPHVMIQDDLDL